MARECSFTGFMKCGPTQFYETEGAVRLVRWFEKMENTFDISECAEGMKVKFATATLHGRALTWWNSQVATLGREVVKLYIKRFLEIIKGEKTSSRPATFNEAVRMAHTLMEEKIQAKNERIVEGIKMKWENNNQGNNNNNNNHNRAQNARANQTGIAPKCNRYGRCHFDQCPPKCDNCGRMRHKAKDCGSKNVASGATVQSNVVCYEYGERGHKSRACPKKADRRGTFLLNNCYATMLFDSGADKSFVDIKFSHLIDIKLVKLNSSYEVKLADGKVVSTNSVLRGCNLLDHLFDIDLMPIELAQVTGKEPAKKQLQDVPLICNFPEMFPDDLPGLPPPRQVEIRIKLIPDVAPVAHAPYHLAPSELKELSDQLKELSEKGFIRPSSSPWGALIDLQSGYRQLRIREKDIPITAFRTRIGPVAYKLELPEKLHGIHNTFHVPNLKKCLADENLVIPLEEIQLDDKLHFIEEPVEIMDREAKQLKQSRIPIVKV
nr:hypothetical protein [Tanacetum cinerariifolium]